MEDKTAEQLTPEQQQFERAKKCLIHRASAYFPYDGDTDFVNSSFGKQICRAMITFYEEESALAAPQREDGFLKGEVGSSVSTEEKTVSEKESDFIDPQNDKKRNIRLIDDELHTAACAHAGANSSQWEGAVVTFKKGALWMRSRLTVEHSSTEDIIEMIDKIIENTTLTGIDLGHRGNTRGMESCDYILGELNYLRSRITAKEKGK